MILLILSSNSSAVKLYLVVWVTFSANTFGFKTVCGLLASSSNVLNFLNNSYCTFGNTGYVDVWEKFTPDLLFTTTGAAVGLNPSYVFSSPPLSASAFSGTEQPTVQILLTLATASSLLSSFYLLVGIMYSSFV